MAIFLGLSFQNLSKTESGLYTKNLTDSQNLLGLLLTNLT
ncbi:hypothetical protein NU08_0317 [Flavobacterium anhuiense]|uniref:Uncharacterized protein n=1 Tax=Flavobacterium anhuiense TaxID=459526 RepID=A0A444W4T3_9FLAO|nr:hypothetical protein NU08_0317 [Flavobacterium anhuiense]